jgi:hypothetical protein
MTDVRIRYRAYCEECDESAWFIGYHATDSEVASWKCEQCGYETDIVVPPGEDDS